MIAKNEQAYFNRYGFNRYTPTKVYSKEQINEIINSSDADSQRLLSWNYFNQNAIYKRILIHYATMLKYVGLLVPHPSASSKLSDKSIIKRYNASLDYIDKMSLNTFLSNCMLRALIDGCYYGIKLSTNKNDFIVLDLPAKYCHSYFKDARGNDLIEFNVSYFLTIPNERTRKEVIKSYPKEIRDLYNQWRKNKQVSPWFCISSDIGICFPFLDGRPPFINIIPSILDYNKAVDTELARDIDEIRKILVQKIPHLTDGQLLFEPDEAEVMHQGAVDMLRSNENISVLTTYADVDAVVSKTASDATSGTIDRLVKTIYNAAGTSSEVFSSTGSNTLESSLKNDLALVMNIADKFSVFITNTINNLFANSNISFKYTILPITYYNQEKYIEMVFKLANSGYSILLPSIAAGIGQNDIQGIKTLENDILKLNELLIPLSSAYTQSSNNDGAGRPKLDDEEKSDKTIANEKSLDNQAGGSN